MAAEFEFFLLIAQWLTGGVMKEED